jgi:hypothetical protein
MSDLVPLDQLEQFAEHGWPAIEPYARPAIEFFVKRLFKLLDGAPKASVHLATTNAAKATDYVNDDIEYLVNVEGHSPENIAARLQDPDVLLTTATLLEDSTEKSEDFWLKQCGALVGALLVSEGNTRRALALQSAAKVLRQLNARQLRLLSLMVTLQFSEVKLEGDPPTYESYARAIHEALAPYDDLTIDALDMRILESLNLATVLQHSRFPSRFLTPLQMPLSELTMEATAALLTPRIRRITAMQQAQNGLGIEATQLSPTGYVVAAIAKSILTGKRIELSAEWDEPKPPAQEQ